MAKIHKEQKKGGVSNVFGTAWRWHKSKYYSKKRLQDWTAFADMLGYRTKESRAPVLILLAALFHWNQDAVVLSDSTAVPVLEASHFIERWQKYNMWRDGMWCLEEDPCLLQQMDDKRHFNMWLILWVGVGDGTFYRDDDGKFGLVANLTRKKPPKTFSQRGSTDLATAR